MQITFITAAFIGFLFVGLGLHVGRMRGVAKTSLGMGEDPRLFRAIRAHANLAEWAPMVLILMAATESLGASRLEMLVLGISFFVARVLHAWGIFIEKDRPTPFRAIGALVTALILLWTGVHTLIMAYGM
ncbi:MAG: hypothetical protein EP335_10245 [Alphaproteobacteria bacterium]|nr:MAG: hypothetical protein EP335_10245 [Alphaproteobacteria bacterium]